MLPGAVTSRFTRICTGMALFLSAMLFVQLQSDSFLRGFDAYYYAVQADSWFRTGSLRIPDSSVIHYCIGALQYTGLSAENALRLWVCFSLFLLFATLIFVLRACASQGLAFFLFCWAVLSPSVLFTALEFPKVLLFMVLLTACAAFAGKNVSRLFLAVPLLLAGCFFHKMAAVYAGAVLCAGIPPLLRERISMPRKLPLFCAIAAGAVLLAYAFLAVDAFHVQDILRLRGTNLLPGVVSLFMQPNLPTAIRAEILFSAAIAGIALFACKKGQRLLPCLLLLPCFIPALGSETFSFGERFGILFPYTALLCYFLCLRDRWVEKVTLEGGLFFNCLRRARGERPPCIPRILTMDCFASANGGCLFQNMHTLATLAAVLVATLSAGYFRLSYAHPLDIDPPYDTYARITQEISPYSPPMLILHRGIHFYYKYHSQRDGFSFEPEKHWNKQRVWRLVYGVTPEEFYAYLPQECGWNTPVIQPLSVEPYTLLREDCYEAMRGNVKKDGNPELYDLLWNNGMNPAEPRPAFLYNKHRDDEKEEFSALP